MIDIKEIILKELKKAGIDTSTVTLAPPKELKNGEYSFFLRDKSADVSKLTSLTHDGGLHKHIERFEVAGPFVNVYLSQHFFTESIKSINTEGTNYGRNAAHKDEKVIVEYTDPNPLKEFHIGHLMSNAVGESLSRLVAWSGATVKRANYQGDVGLHVAKAIWGMQELSGEMPHPKEELNTKAAFLGKAYVHGSNAHEDDEHAKKEIDALNKVIFEKSDPKIMELYDWGRKVSLDYFEIIYAKLGTRFDYYFFESEVAHRGMFIVEEFLKKGVFEKSDGAIVFKGEQYGLHTRVFINSQGLPTYETKELGLNTEKFDRENFDRSIIITAHEQSEYFKVVLKALEFVAPTVANKTKHIAHGMLRFASGKMSSRKGNVIPGDALIVDIEKMVHEKIKDRDTLTDAQKREVMEQVAVGAIKYSILKQSIGKDIIFDMEKSLSFEGDSGPYLQYAHARSQSILEKAKATGITASLAHPEAPGDLEKLLIKFPDIAARAERELGPQQIVTYLTELAATFNAYYAHNPIVLEDNPASPYRVALTQAFNIVMKNGLFLLGIAAPEKM